MRPLEATRRFTVQVPPRALLGPHGPTWGGPMLPQERFRLRLDSPRTVTAQSPVAPVAPGVPGAPVALVAPVAPVVRVVQVVPVAPVAPGVPGAPGVPVAPAAPVAPVAPVAALWSSSPFQRRGAGELCALGDPDARATWRKRRIWHAWNPRRTERACMATGIAVRGVGATRQAVHPQASEQISEHSCHTMLPPHPP